MAWILHWLDKYQSIALWLEGIALVAIFIWDRLDNNAQHKQTQEQLRIAQDQVAQALRAADAARDAANAAKESADAGKKSADISAALHRPYIGVDNVLAGGAGRIWDTVFKIKNFGTLPALEVGFTAEYFVETTPRLQHVEPSRLQVFPADSYQLLSRFDSGVDDAGPLRGGERKLTVQVLIPYKTPEGRAFEYKAWLSYIGGQFRIDASSTTERR